MCRIDLPFSCVFTSVTAADLLPKAYLIFKLAAAGAATRHLGFKFKSLKAQRGQPSCHWRYHSYLLWKEKSIFEAEMGTVEKVKKASVKIKYACGTFYMKLWGIMVTSSAKILLPCSKQKWISHIFSKRRWADKIWTTCVRYEEAIFKCMALFCRGCLKMKHLPVFSCET